MPAEHDLIQHLHNLQQALRSGKTPLGLFLGAGCPSAVRADGDRPLIPPIQGLTQSCINNAQEDPESRDSMAKLLAKLSDDGAADPNIERILTEIRALLRVVGTGAFSGLRAPDLERLEHHICDHIVQVASPQLPCGDTPYHTVARWVGAIQRSEPVEIFTPNYDLLVEQALEHTRVPYFDGFVGSRHAFFDPHAVENDQLPSRWARLWKLHGSINWYMREDGTVFRTGETTAYDCRLIHPSHLKYEESRTMPYFVMIDRLRRFLTRSASLLAICGYSFRDEHLNAAIADGLQSNPNAVAFGLLHGKMESRASAVALASAVPNLVLLAQDQGIIRTTPGAWLESRPDDSDQWEPVVTWEEHQPSLNLGDFAVLGAFLADVVGRL